MSNRQHVIRDQEAEARDAVAQAWGLLDEHERKKALPLLRKAIDILENIRPVGTHDARAKIQSVGDAG